MAMFRKNNNTTPAEAEEEVQVLGDANDDEEYTPLEEETETEEDRATAVFEDDELQYLWCYVNQVSLQGRLYFKDEIKIDDTTISNRVASFNLLIKKKTKNGVKRHRIYVKTYNKDIIEWLTNQEVGTWVKVEGRLEAASNKTYVNATSITAFSEERMKAIFENVDGETPNVDWKDYDKSNESEINKTALKKLQKIKQQTHQLAVSSNSVYVDDEDTPVTASAARGSLTQEDIDEITTKTKDLIASYKAYINSLESEEYEEEEEAEDYRYERNEPPMYEKMRKYPTRTMPERLARPNLRRELEDDEYERREILRMGLRDAALKERNRAPNDKYDSYEFADYITDEPFNTHEDNDDILNEYEDYEDEIMRPNPPSPPASVQQYPQAPSSKPAQQASIPQPPQAVAPAAPIPQEGDVLPAGARLVRSDPANQTQRISGRASRQFNRSSRYNR